MNTAWFIGKRYWVVAATQGIGWQTAKDLLNLGADVTISGRDPERLKEAHEALTEPGHVGHLSTCVVDLTDDTAVRYAAQSVISNMDGLDGVVVSSGGPVAGGLFDLSDTDWMQSIDGKLLGHIRVTRAILPYFMGKRSGRIVHLSGTHGLQPQHYALTAGVVNAGIINFVKAVAAFAARNNVLINVVNPGPVSTERMQYLAISKATRENRGIPETLTLLSREVALERFAETHEVTSLIVYLLSEGASFCSGGSYNVDGGQLHGI